jgi:ABC-type Fe3+-hydroxamate transport system substrate-binding protein
MNKGIITIACAVIAPVAFAQTSSTTTEQTTTTAPVRSSETVTTTAPTTTTETTTTYSAGTVTTYDAGKTIVVKDESGGPVRFALGTAARIVDGAGKIVTAPIRAGQKVRVYYNGTGETRTVDHVVVQD